MFVIARQHPGEANGSFVLQGFLRWICSDTPEAMKMREIALIKVVPMLNPDGVILGNFRTSMCGKDLNRLFKSRNSLMFPEV
jgi:murein tripeptide amidase MpaA